MTRTFRTVAVYPDKEEQVFELKKGFKVVDITRHFYPPTLVISEPSDAYLIKVAFKVVKIRDAVEEDGFKSVGAEYFQKDLCIILSKTLH